MSGGVDSSVAAALLRDQGHDVVGATMKLWSGASDSGCCSVADVDDARRVAQQLGLDHHVFNFTADFDAHVVDPYVDAHRVGLTPNPCIECNRHLKFDRFLDRALALGFDAIATGHHARIVETDDGRALHRGTDRAKDQSYVLHMVGPRTLAKVVLPVGELTKVEVRARATELGLRTATKPDSQDVCFISRVGGRHAFLSERIELHPATVIEVGTGAELGSVEAVELVTVGQRRGMGGGHEDRRYAVSVDPAARRVVTGTEADLLTREVMVDGWEWIAPVPPGDELVDVQSSAHGVVTAGTVTGDGVALAEPIRRVAPGQSVVLYRGDRVLGGGIAR
jgi:tRNA-specific 2-thiouridylase